MVQSSDQYHPAIASDRAAGCDPLEPVVPVVLSGPLTVAIAPTATFAPLPAALWHLRRDRADATEVEIRFIGLGEATTRVEIEHRGWERLGAEGVEWRDRNMGGWRTLLPHYVAAVRS
jgi:hypothetical protein